jgi:tRNA(Arg) A34 adenosine deaminase TadA
MTDHLVFIRRAIELAQASMDKGNHPFGALIVYNDEILIEAENTVVSERNPTCHAEMNAVNLAWKSLPREKIEGSTLYTSCEPCPMCTGAIFWSGIRKVVFSLPALTLGQIANDKFCCPCNTLFERADLETVVIGPILPEESVVHHQSFWTAYK